MILFRSLWEEPNCMLTACNVFSVQWLTTILHCSVLNGKHITCSQPAWLVSFTFCLSCMTFAMHRGRHRHCSAAWLLHAKKVMVIMWPCFFDSGTFDIIKLKSRPKTLALRWGISFDLRDMGPSAFCSNGNGLSPYPFRAKSISIDPPYSPHFS